MGGGCPLTPGPYGRWRPSSSRVPGAAQGRFSVALSTWTRFRFPLRFLRAAACCLPREHGRCRVLQETADREEIIERVAALDIGKAEVMCCVRVPDEDHPGKRLQEVQPYPALNRSVLRMSDHLASLGVARVVMEATADYQ